MDTIESVKQTYKDNAIKQTSYLKLSDLQKGLNKRNRRLQDPKLRKSWLNDPNKERKFLWESDPSRQIDAFDSAGEVAEYNEEHFETAVQRIFVYSAVNGRRAYKSVLVRRETCKPVAWNSENKKWIDIPTDDKYTKLIKKVLDDGGTNNNEVAFHSKKQGITIEEFEQHLEKNKIKMQNWIFEDSFYGKYGDK